MSAKKEIKIETPKGNYFYSCGKRKTAIAKVRFYPKGTNEITVNGVDISEWSDYPEQIRSHIKTIDTYPSFGGSFPVASLNQAFGV